MDPWTCVYNINDYFTMNNPQAAIPYIAALKGWIDKGGFKPANFNEEDYNNWISWARL